jgi:hypothetical protein
MSQEQAQVFSLEAVNAMIPELQSIVARQLARRMEIEERIKTLAALSGAMPEEITPPSPNDSEAVRELKRDLLGRIAEYQAAWQEVERMGAVLKDPRQGLLDFYGRVDGKLVWLCWKYGEHEVSHYHALDEGFSGRKAIGLSIKQRLLN